MNNYIRFLFSLLLCATASPMLCMEDEVELSERTRCVNESIVGGLCFVASSAVGSIISVPIIAHSALPHMGRLAVALGSIVITGLSGSLGYACCCMKFERD